MQLIVVESPTKAKTISNFLGKDYKVESSFGHVRDLPKSKLGIDTTKDFAPSYVIPTKARKLVNELKKEAAKSEATILATDEDREGEAIAWHLAQVLGLENPQRIVFHEITKSAIEEALKNPGVIDINRVNAQQARRILDRLVGYELSPFLWQKVAKRLSAGRVQSAAVRLIADREKEIKAFIPQEYWTLEALFEKEKKEFSALLKLNINNKEETDEILKNLDGAEYRVESIEKKETKRNSFPPFTTSTLQQESSRKLHFSSKFTMSLAQNLYEMGLITYHRTDSLNLSELSKSAAKDFIEQTYGKEYWPGFSRTFKNKSKGAQEAHEAIRPTDPFFDPSSVALGKDSAVKLYDLIWTRFLASQMSQALFDSTVVEIAARNYTFRATGQTLGFDGFLKVYPIQFTETQLPPLKQSEILNLKSLDALQHFTQAPPRYTEASLIKALEEYGIGRPSTYAPTLSTIQDRGYIEKDDQKRFYPTDLGNTVNDMLVTHFPNIVDIAFTAHMEQQLDNIAKGEEQWIPMIKQFYEPFAKNLQKKYLEVPKKQAVLETTNKQCPQCGSPVIIRTGRFGKFYACSTFPKCKYTESLETKNAPIGMACPKCSPRFAGEAGGKAAPAGASLSPRSTRVEAGAPSERGEVVMKRTRKGRMFYGCNRYPDCDFASWKNPVLAKETKVE